MNCPFEGGSEGDFMVHEFYLNLKDVSGHGGTYVTPAPLEAKAGRSEVHGQLGETSLQIKFQKQNGWGVACLPSIPEGSFPITAKIKCPSSIRK